MADKKEKLNLGAETGKAEGKGGMKKIIIIVVALLVVGGGVGGFLMMGGEEAATPIADEAGSVEEVVEAVDEDADPIYMPLTPAFVVNFQHNGTMRYLQLSLQIMSYDQEVLDKVTANMPAVRNSLIMLFSGQDYDALNTVEGKENLRGEVLKSIHQVVRFNGSLKVNDVFFTGFVMQ